MAVDCPPSDVFALLDDEYARTLLAATSTEPMTPTELSQQCEMSRATVYRRLNALEECGLVTSELELDADGHHTKRYEAQLDELSVILADGQFEVEIETRTTTQQVADAFTDLWEGL